MIYKLSNIYNWCYNKYERWNMDLKEIDINLAIKLLKKDIILYSIIDKKETFFKYENNNIMIKNSNSIYYLIEYDFLQLFKNIVFSIYENDEELIDEERDREYYSIDKIKK